ncbi:MAG: BrnT family toxin [Desulfobacteraceae bacterium]|jgi:uncharacterized DUF497 family protein
MEFEFDIGKSNQNREKHGIDFMEAQLLWEDPDRIVIPARTVDEPRYLLIGKISEKHWSAVFTHRHEKIRIISVRRARREEVDIYES